MARVTKDEVLVIIKPNTQEITEKIDSFIRTANVMVTDALGSEGYTAATLKEIELYLTAHFIAIRDPRIASTGEATYQGRTGLGLDHTSYGQQAQVLDYRGGLTRVSKTKGEASLAALPNPEVSS